MEWEAVIGLEVHVSLSTNTKLFSGTASIFGALADRAGLVEAGSERNHAPTRNSPVTGF